MHWILNIYERVKEEGWTLMCPDECRIEKCGDEFEKFILNMN